MIEKLETGDTRPEVLIEKVNEVIDVINRSDSHYHTSLDTRYNTTFPKYESAESRNDETP